MAEFRLLLKTPKYEFELQVPLLNTEPEAFNLKNMLGVGSDKEKESEKKDEKPSDKKEKKKSDSGSEKFGIASGLMLLTTMIMASIAGD